MQDDLAGCGIDDADPEREPRSSRRRFVFFGALAAIGVGPARSAAQSRVTRSRATIRDAGDASLPATAKLPNEMVAAPAYWSTSTTRLARRLTNGVTRGDTLVAANMGYQGYLNWQLNYTRIDNTAMDAAVALRYPSLAYAGTELFPIAAQSVAALQDATIYRAAFSRRQLYERMVEFWTDHFSIDAIKVSYLKVIDDREVIRKNALGNFGTMLRASAHSPAMLLYLDQQLSRSGNPNQNYARELLELHTVGVDGGYTQDDVAELSRVLTGWSIQGRGNFFFDSGRHDTGAKTVMGMNFPATPGAGASGINEGEQFLTFLIDHPNTARYISTKMLKWLLTPEPSESQIKAVTSVYRATKGDIKSMVRAILNEQWLMAAPLKFKRPFHFMASALRSTAPTVGSAANALTNMHTQLSNIGQPLFYWETPDGYPDSAEFWAGNILPRWALASTIALSNSASTVQVNVAPYMAGTADAAIDLIDQDFFGSEMPTATRLALLNFLRGGGALTTTRVRDTLSLAMASAAFQWY